MQLNKQTKYTIAAVFAFLAVMGYVIFKKPKEENK